MKKYLTILFFLCCIIPLTVYAAEILNTKNSFQLAKAVKLGRGNNSVAFSGSDFSSGGSSSFLQNCADHCAVCDRTSGVCSRCESGYSLINNKCKLDSCSPGQYFNGSACSVCPEGKYSAGGSATSCTPCAAGTYASGTGNASCQTCSPQTFAAGTGNSVCTPCPAGKYSAAGASACSSCPGTCTSCTNASSCTACVSQYHISGGASTGTCVGNCENVTCISGAKKVVSDKSCCCVMETASIANCATQSGSTCTKCNSGYYLSDNTCKSCPSNASCSGTSSFSCNSGYYKNGTVCSSCSSAIAGCSTCTASGSLISCTQCQSHYVQSGASCVHDCDYWSISYTSCQQGYRKPVSGGGCEKCPANTQCGTCPSGCTGSTAGSCSSQNYTCFMCLIHESNECKCPSGYTPTLDGTTCISTSGTGWPQACTYI